MIREQIDKHSGAILFKKDPDSLRYEELLRKVNEQEEKLANMEKEIKSLKKSK